MYAPKKITTCIIRLKNPNYTMKSPINYTYYPVKRIFRSTKIIDILKKREQVTGIEVFFRLMQYYFGVAYYPAIGTK